MNTIVKGKHQIITYSLTNTNNSIFKPDPFFYMSLGEQHYLNSLINLKERIENSSELICIAQNIPVTIDYESFYTTDKLDFTLSVGDLLFIDDLSYKIERVEGINNNTIIYFVDNVLSCEEDFNSLEATKKLFDEWKQIKLNEIEQTKKDIEFNKKLQNKIAEKNNEIDSYIAKQYNKKWYQFWKI